MSHATSGADLAAIEAMIGALPAFLDGDDLFRVVVFERPGGADKITMTLGALLDALDDATARDADSARITAARQTLNDTAAGRADRFTETLHRELRSALNDWRALAEDMEHGSDDLGEDWGYATRNRARAERLLLAAAERGIADGGARAELAQADAVVRKHVAPADFQGAPGTQDRFPRDSWWWLWSAPRR